MSRLAYYKRYPRDLVEGTVGLSFEAKTSYAYVLDLIYMYGGKLPDDKRYIAGQLNCTLQKWTKVRNELISAGKLEEIDGKLLNNRAETELKLLENYQKTQRENRSNPNKNSALEKPSSHHTEPYPEPEPDTEDIEAKASTSKGAVEDAAPDQNFCSLSEEWFDRIVEAAAPAMTKQAVALSWVKRGPAWMAQWALDDVLPTVKAVAATRKPGEIKSVTYFEKAIAETLAANKQPIPDIEASYDATETTYRFNPDASDGRRPGGNARNTLDDPAMRALARIVGDM